MKKIVRLLIASMLAVSMTGNGLAASNSSEDYELIGTADRIEFESGSEGEFIIVEDMTDIAEYEYEAVNFKFTEEYSPYVIGDDSIFIYGQTIIEPGTEIQFNGEGSLFVSDVVAEGTYDKPVTIIGNTDVDDVIGNFVINEGNIASFKYCQIYNMQTAIMDIRDEFTKETSLVVDNCYFSDNWVSISGCAECSEITNNTFNNNNINAIYLEDVSELGGTSKIYNCTFTSDTEGYGTIDIWSDKCEIFIDGCEFSGEYEAINVEGIENKEVANVQITNNLFDCCDTAIRLLRAYVNIVNNNFTKCSLAIYANEDYNVALSACNNVFNGNTSVIEVLDNRINEVVGGYDLSYNCFVDGTDCVIYPEDDDAYNLILDGLREYDELRGPVSKRVSVENDAVTVELTKEVKNEYVHNVPMKAEVYLAVYDKETGEMLDIEKQELMVMKAARKLVFDLCDKEYELEDVDIKMFIWDGVEEMVPFEVIDNSVTPA